MGAMETEGIVYREVPNKLFIFEEATPTNAEDFLMFIEDHIDHFN